MPTFFELQKRIKSRQETHVRLGTDEVLIIDPRGAMRPGDFVDEKLRAAQSSSEVTRIPLESTESARRKPR